MKNQERSRRGAIILSLLLIGGFLSIPVSGIMSLKEALPIYHEAGDHFEYIVPGSWQYTEEPPQLLDVPISNLQPIEALTLTGEHQDIGYNVDAGNAILQSSPIYIGEPVDETIPGRGRTASLDGGSGDRHDWYTFTACEGQSFSATVSNGFSYEFYDHEGMVTGETLDTQATGRFFFHVFTESGSGEYTIDISAAGQNDAGTGGDAGNDINSATSISPGSYSGYMSYQDVEDWYSFSASSGQGIFVTVDPISLSDYDIHLYDPSGTLVHSAQFYGEDNLEYPSDASGNWKIKIDMFPGWDTEKWPDNYFLYGSGAYELELSIGGSAESPPGPIPQREITPIAQTFIINDDPSSNMDEYGYLAAVPAANYLDNGERFVSPIVYQGNDEITHWFGTIDDTTQYLLDDWNEYLSNHGMTAEEYIVPDDPIEAAAEIATNNWESSSTAVVVCDGSSFADTIDPVFDETVSLSSSPEITRVSPGGFTQLGTEYYKIMYIGRDYGAIQMLAHGEGYGGDTAIITPRYERVQDDDWPYPYDENGPDMDTWYPITKPGFWLPLVTSESGLDQLEIIKYKGDRYTIPIDNTDASIEVTVETDQPSFLMVYLIDPDGNVRRPMIPKWNGGEIQPIHYWNGGHWEHNYEDYRRNIMEPGTEYSVSVHNAMPGDWTAIVVPHYDHETGYAEFNGDYHITANVRTYSANRVNAALSAANGAVIASMNHAPLLYVTQDAVPSETTDALNALGVSNIIFVNIGEVSAASVSASQEYTTMQQVVDAIKDHQQSENFITITSMGTGEGYFAPAAMAAASHIAPVLNIGEANEAYNLLDIATAWREHAADHYHGCRTMGHLPYMDHPSELPNPPSWLQIIIYYLQNDELPHPGLDLELQLRGGIYEGIHALIEGYGLDLSGQEAYLFVSPRDTDIRDLATISMLGNNSYAGQIMFETTALSTAHICRDILYPAIIYANPGRDEISSCFMNFRNGHDWTCNDGNRYNDYVTQIMKQSGFSHGRTFKGHSIWNNLLEQYNGGAALIYHCSHGTGGSGICCMYENIEEQFPLCEITHDHLRDFNWWDGWRGYLFDNTRTPTPRVEGLVWFNAHDRLGNLYDIVHFKWCDQLFDNLHSQFNMWMSCTTGSNFGPDIYLEHGCALWFGNGNTGRSPQEEVLDQWMIQDLLIQGKSVGESISAYIWLHQRDYTTMDPTTIYGSSSMQVSNEQMIFGDPTMTVYSPEWTEPVPVLP
jgi:hypothetical protein